MTDDDYGVVMVIMTMVVIVVIMVVSGSVGDHRCFASVCGHCWYQNSPIVPMLANNVIMMVMMAMVMVVVLVMVMVMMMMLMIGQQSLSRP